MYQKLFTDFHINQCIDINLHIIDSRAHTRPRPYPALSALRNISDKEQISDLGANVPVEGASTVGVSRISLSR